MTERKMKDGFWMLLCAACLLLSARSVQARELTALDILPSCRSPCLKTRRKAFEDEKLRLIEQGQANFGGGAVRRRSPRTGIAAFGETRVGLRVFREGQAACRTRDGRGRHVRP